MNKLFKSPRKLLSYSLLITATIMALGVILVAFFGFNKSYQFGGYYEINIDYLDMEKKDEYVNGIDEILNKYGYTVDHYAMEGDKSFTPTLCVRYESNSEEDAKNIKADIISKFNIDEKSTLLSVEKMSSSYASHKIAYLLIPMSILLVALFVFGWYRRNILYGVAEAIEYLSTILVGLSLYAVTRTMISLSSLSLLFISALLSSLLFTYFSVNAFSKKNTIHSEKKELSDLFCDAMSANKFITAIPALAMLAVFVGLIFTFNHSLMHLGFAGIICICSIIWTSIFVTGSYFVSVVNAESKREKKSLSRNNTVNNEN